MIHLPQNIQKRMLGKEWLAKIDNETATPYLLVGSTPFIAQISEGRALNPYRTGNPPEISRRGVRTGMFADDYGHEINLV